ncbi:uncharacterized protein BDZ99DRAFT_548099 [Mytilinidion resinicola]|uniref:Uncharacterized protein n=1 Tax=Mytilinidion resinicola TaxID=574789 RepID=A0A6A6Y239_9PEZI|nr:uncharacterized protein BDZ99DRAFT_548099 [Mytilinidion resinicola]KAF2802881.1 hypothetical protein BDZ99DRAFT_548099 [Mytilinidion resinicola]
MASSCSTSLLAPSFPMKIVPYVPRAPKPKPKSKVKSTATTKTAEHSRSGVGSFEDDGEWFHIDDFPRPNSDASRSLDPAVPALLGAADASDVVGGLSGASELEKPEHYQSGRESLNRGTDYATSVEKVNLAVNGFFDGSSRKHHSTQVKLSHGYHAAASTEGYRAGEHGDATSMRALSVGDMEGIRHEPSLAEDESPFGDVDMTSRSPLTCKRTHRLSVDTIISSAEVPDFTSEPELEDSRLAKRQRSELQAESLMLDHVPKPRPTHLPTPNSLNCRSRASNEPSPGPLDSDGQGGGAGRLVPHPNNLDGDTGDDGAHARGTVEELLHSSPFEGVESDQDIDLGLERREKNRKGSDDEAGESHEDELGQVDRCPVDFRTDSTTWSCSPRTSPPGTKAGGGGHGPNANMVYQITDLTHYYVPEACRLRQRLCVAPSITSSSVVKAKSSAWHSDRRIHGCYWGTDMAMVRQAYVPAKARRCSMQAVPSVMLPVMAPTAQTAGTKSTRMERKAQANTDLMLLVVASDSAETICASANERMYRGWSRTNCGYSRTRTWI